MHLVRILFVQANLAVASIDEFSTYTVYMMMPGDWSQARIFSWIYDVANVQLESDGTSTLVTLVMNDNSVVLESGKWANFFVGFDNIPEHISAGIQATYKMGIVPGEGSSNTCIMDVNAASPPESLSRVLPRKQRRREIRQALKNQRTTAAKERLAEYNEKLNVLKNYDQTVFIPAASGVQPFYGR